MLELYTHQNWTEETHYKLRKLMINGTERKGKRKTQPKIYQKMKTHFQILPVHRQNDGACAQICPS